MANEIIYVPPFIKSVLAADGALIAAISASQHHHRRVPQGATTFPRVLYRFYDGDVGQTQNKRKLIAAAVYRIVAVRYVRGGETAAEKSAARTGANRIDVLFGEDSQRRVSFTAPAPDSTVFTFNSYLDDLGYIDRELPGATEEEFYIHTGGFYRFEVFN